MTLAICLAGVQVSKVVDERGATWVLPGTTAAMKLLLNEYGRVHGSLPSRAVQVAFRRHGQLDQLRMLVLRGAEGERINLAARALALGPMPPLVRALPQGRQGWPDPHEVRERLDALQGRRDAECTADLRAEAGAEAEALGQPRRTIVGALRWKDDAACLRG